MALRAGGKVNTVIIGLVMSLVMLVNPFHDFHVKNTGNESLIVCDHWGFPEGRQKAKSCGTNGNMITLLPGERSIGIDDVDAVCVPYGYKVKRKLYLINVYRTVGGVPNKWPSNSIRCFKVTPSLTHSGFFKVVPKKSRGSW